MRGAQLLPASAVLLGLLAGAGCGRCGFESHDANRDGCVTCTDAAGLADGERPLRDGEAPRDAARPADSSAPPDGAPDAAGSSDGGPPACTTDCTITVQWVRAVGGRGSDQVNDVVPRTRGGGATVGGIFEADVDFGGGTISSTGIDTSGFVAAYGSSNAHRWSIGIGNGSSGRDRAEGIAVDGAGNVYVVGAFSDTIDVGGGPLVSDGFLDVFVASYTEDGVHRWSDGFGSPSNDEGLAVVAGTADIYVTGSYRNDIDFSGRTPLGGGSGDNTFFVRFDSDGTHRWSFRQPGGCSDHAGRAIALSGSRLAATGGFNCTIDFGMGALSAIGMNDAFVAGYGTDGSTRWGAAFGGPERDRGYAAAIDAAGNAYYAGEFLGRIDNAGGGRLSSAGGRDIWVMAHDVGGTHRWSDAFGDTGDDTAEDLVVDAAGNVYLAGRFSGSVDFGGGVLTSAGGSDVFVASFTGGGTHRWSRRWGGTGDDVGYAVAVDGSVVWVGGRFDRTVDFGTGPVSSNGQEDAFLMRLVVE